MEPVRSPRNQRVADAVRLRRARERRQRKETLLEGPNLIEAAAAGGVALRAVFALEDDQRTAGLAAVAGWELITVKQSVLDRLAPTKNPRGPVAVMAIPESVPIEDRSVVVLWGVGDPGNVGTLIRSAGAFGFGVICGPQSADPWSPKVLRAATGAHLSVPIETNLGDIDVLRTRGIKTVAAVVDGGLEPSGLKGSDPIAVIVGDEAHGLSADLVATCESRVSIPMSTGLESLNAAVAGSILMYALSEGRI